MSTLTWEALGSFALVLVGTGAIVFDGARGAAIRPALVSGHVGDLWVDLATPVVRVRLTIPLFCRLIRAPNCCAPRGGCP